MIPENRNTTPLAAGFCGEGEYGSSRAPARRRRQDTTPPRRCRRGLGGVSAEEAFGELEPRVSPGPHALPFSLALPREGLPSSTSAYAQVTAAQSKRLPRGADGTQSSTKSPKAPSRYPHTAAEPTTSSLASPTTAECGDQNQVQGHPAAAVTTE